MAIPLCTEYKGWLSGQAYPGHEAAGEVVEVSPGCEVQIGDRVAVMPTNPCGDCELCGQGEYIHCQNNLNFEAETGLNTGGDTHVRYLAKQDWMLAKIPKSVPLELGALACCGLGPTFGACENLGVDGASTVLIAGAGPVGLGGVINAKYRGAKVICMEPVEYRRNLALSLGADLALDPNAGGFAEAVLDFTGGRGADFALEAS
ncbi:MAG: alcohol dehydrogenase catalytic domain-containing protein, partial [Oscillospiraceae bacterium]|nr:alcohol dehydrogenase catalytic domain-containing protein [Oscillospiraceae bacterium]